MRRHLTRPAALVASLVSLLAVLVATTSQAAVPHAKVEGSGSSWAANAVNQWIADVTSSGIQVVFSSQGSAQGRKDFTNNTTDYAVSDIGYRGTLPNGDLDPKPNRSFAYLPIVAGGTSFPYNLVVGGKRVRDLRLSGLTLAKIFTNQIKSWDNAAITADNNGRKLPKIAIVPLVHAEGSGSTAQLTTYFDTVYPSIWRPYFGGAGFTEFYPKRGGVMIGQSGSDQIINYATSAAANGVITYDEYSYALAKNFPVAKVKNAGGYFTLPTQYNVAVALRKAQINTNKNDVDHYLLQDLHQVFANPDPRTYALSSYSYMIIPTGASDPRMSTAKRQTLVDYLYYSVCTGQKEMGPIGYSPLPINLVQASFDQTNKLKTADPKVDITKRDVSTCHNPTFVAGDPNRNYLAEIAPQPPACDRSGAGPCTGAASQGINGNPNAGQAPSAATGSGAGAGSAAPGTGGAGSGSPGSPTPTGGASAPATAGATAGAKTTIDPATGEVVALGATAAGVDANQAAVPTDVAATSSVSQWVLGQLTIAILLLAIALPPVIGRTLSRRARGRR